MTRGRHARPPWRMIAMLAIMLGIVGSETAAAGGRPIAQHRHHGHFVASRTRSGAQRVRVRVRAPRRGRTTVVKSPRAAISQPAPATATLTFPATSADTCGHQCLPSNALVFLYTNDVSHPGVVPLTVTATPPAGASITSVVLQYAPAGSGNFTTFGGVPFTGSGPYTAQLSSSQNIGFHFPPFDGNYDFRAAAYDDGSTTPSFYSQVVRNVAMVYDQPTFPNPGDTFVGLQGPGQFLHGTVDLLAAPEQYSSANAPPDTVTFQISPVGAGSWSDIGGPVSAKLDGSGNPILDAVGAQEYGTSLNTTGFRDGQYDLRVKAENSYGDPFLGGVITVTIDNTPPTVTLANPGGSLSGIQTLSATAASAAGIASVRFQYAPSGSTDWSTIGVATGSPYTADFDTRGLANGSYDLRAVATDVAGNTATSVVSGVSVSNSSGGGSAASFSVSPTDVPATGSTGAGTSHITLLGEVAGSSDHETWAFGYTTAPPAVVNGTPLPYTNPPGAQQLVLLRYTATSGWEIADVLRNADGSAYDVSPSAVVEGQMTRSGEAWMIVLQNGTDGVFHRLPGGRFTLDSAATTAVAPIVSGPAGVANVQLRLGEQPDGTIYGTLVNPNQVATPISLNTGGTTTTVRAALQYGVLANGAWTVQSAPVPPQYQPFASDVLTLTSVSPTGPAAGWGLFSSAQSGVDIGNPNPQPLLLGSFSSSGWTFASGLGLDALDLTGGFAAGSPQGVVPQGILAASDGVWLQASLASLGVNGTIVALYDPTRGRITRSWCDSAVLSQSAGCAEPLDANHPAALPDAVFDTPGGPVALALGQGFVDEYANGHWSSVAASGFNGGSSGTALFADPTDGWLAGANAVGEVSAQPRSAQLTEWPQANQNTLVGVAVPPAGAGTGTSGALAVGLGGAALHYDASQGWLPDPVPTRAQHVNLLGAAYDGSTQGVAVGGLGTILDWNGTSWSEDPQSQTVTQNQLNAVAFGSDGQGWAVGSFGTILHYDGATWSPEQIDPQDSGTNVTSVAVAGGQAYAIAGGNLIDRGPGGTWQRVSPSQLPSDLPANSLTLVSGLPDGGVVAAGDSILIQRSGGSAPFVASAQPIQGIAVALAAFRDNASGELRSLVSVAPPANVAGVTQKNVAGFPAGDGELLKQTGNGFLDLSRAQYPGTGVPGDGAPEPDPVLAVAAAPDGTAAWAVGGYAGTQTAAGLGTDQPLQARPLAWQTASIWRYDLGGGAAPPSLSQAQIELPAQPNTVSFAFLSDAVCKVQCSAVQAAQPDVNLQGAANEISNFAAQPGGPAFAVLGGNAVGPLSSSAQQAGNGATDLSDLHKYLAPLGSLPLYAAYGPLDPVPSSSDPAGPWDDTFAQSPAPFGLGSPPSGITQVSSGGQSGSVHHYYAYDVAQNGGTLRVIVLDNSAGSLDASQPGQSAWLRQQLSAAQAATVPVVVIASQPLDSGLSGSSYQAGSATDADQVATELANAGVLAVFSTSPTQSDQVHMIPYQDPSAPPTGQAQIPEYEGGAVGYQQTQNNGVLWYFVSVDTAHGTVTVQGIPVVQSLALEPLDGLSPARSTTLSFRAVARRPPGSLEVTPGGTYNDGIANYVAIPAPSCGGCVNPSYSFASSNPAIGDFVKPSGAGSQFPALNASGKPIHSATSGLFCAYNAGTTTVSVTSGLLTSSLTVSVQPGPIGQPCGTVAYAPDENVVTVARRPIFRSSTSGVGTAPPPPPAAKVVSPVLPKIALVTPPPPPALRPAHPVPKPAHIRPSPPAAPLPAGQPLQPTAALGTPPVAIPLMPPAVTPVPPGGATVSAQAAARREEKARKEASQSAFTTRPAGASAIDWFYPAVGVVGVLAVILTAVGIQPGPRRRPALVEAWQTDDPRRRRPM